jgi:hypothetical protein
MGSLTKIENRTSALMSEELTSKVVLDGDLSKLSIPERAAYYVACCRHLGLEPATRPFDLLKQGNAVKLYPNAVCAQQLNSKHKCSHKILKIERDDVMNVLVVQVEMTTADGKSEVDIGAVPVYPKMGAEDYANALKKAVTQAKRRSTLSGFGVLGGADLNEQEAAQMIVMDSDVIVPAEAIEAVSFALEEPAAIQKDLVRELVQAGEPEVRILAIKKLLLDKGVKFHGDGSVTGMTDDIHQAVMHQVLDMKAAAENG